MAETSQHWKENNNTRTICGETALDGSNPTAISTTLATITGFSATISSASSTGVGTSVLTYATSGGTVSVYAWKVTASGNATLVASTGTETIGYCIQGY